MKKVKDFMNKNVISFRPSDSIFDVAKTFSEKNISGAPVIERGRLVGMVSASDIVKFMSMRLAASPLFPSKMIQHSLSLMVINFLRVGKNHLEFKKELKKISKTRVKDVMSKNAITIGPDGNLYEVASLMHKRDINRLPVVENGKVIGIVAREDLVRALVE